MLNFAIVYITVALWAQKIPLRLVYGELILVLAYGIRHSGLRQKESRWRIPRTDSFQTDSANRFRMHLLPYNDL